MMVGLACGSQSVTEAIADARSGLDYSFYFTDRLNSEQVVDEAAPARYGPSEDPSAKWQ